MAEYDKNISGYFVSNGTSEILNLPFPPDWIEMRVQGNGSGNVWTNSSSSSLVKEAYWYDGMAQGSALATVNTGSAATDQKSFITSNGFTVFETASGLLGPMVTGSAITAASTPAVTMTNTYQNGDVVYLTNTTGMLQVAGLPFTISGVSGGGFDLAYLNASGFAAAATNVVAQQLIYPGVYTPNLAYITGITTGTTTQVQFSVTVNFSVGETIRFNIPSQFGTVQLNGLLGQITAINTGTNTVTVNINSTNFTAFSFPTSAVAASGVTYAHAVPVGEIASTFASSFVDNGTYGVVIGSSLVPANGDLCFWKAGLSLNVYTS